MPPWRPRFRSPTSVAESLLRFIGRVVERGERPGGSRSKLEATASASTARVCDVGEPVVLQ